MKKIYLILAIVLSTSSLAQNGVAGISGVLNNEFGVAIPYATILAYSLPDSALVNGGSSDTLGKFMVDLKPGNYFIKIRFLSYEEQLISDLVVRQQLLDLGIVIMKEKTEMLDAIDVNVDKPVMELKLDKRVFNVQHDLSNTGLNAAEVLDNVPSISVDAEGNVSLRGSQNVRILINGKPSTLTGMSNADALRQINGSMIESVEVITNPSARYDAEGEVGIINIILKKEMEKGFNGSINARVGYPLGYGLGFNLNYRNKRANFFLGYGWGLQRSPGEGYNYQTFDSPDTSYRYEQTSKHERGGWSHNVNGGVDLSITKTFSLNISGSIQFSEGINWNVIDYFDYDSSGTLTQTVSRDEDEIDFGNRTEIGAGFRKTYSKKDRLWTGDVKRMFSFDNEISALHQYSAEDASQNAVQRTTNNESEDSWLIQTDYIHPFAKDGKFETGAKINLRTLYSDYLLEDSVDYQFWEINNLFNNQMFYTENIYAAYIMAGNKTKTFSYQAGIRAEYSDVTTYLVLSDTTNSRRYLRFFPSFHFSYELKKNNFLQVSYSRRISRPRHWWLTPFYTFRDSRNFETGNPNINPEFAGSYELGHLKYWKKGSLLTSLYYRHTVDVMERILITDSTGITWRLPVNLGDRNSYGLECSGSYEIYKWWNISASVNLYRAISEGEYGGILYAYDAFAWNGKVTSKFTIKRKFSLQSSFTYESPSDNYQGTQRAQYFWDASASVDLFKGNATLSFNGRDILNSRKRRSVVSSQYFYSESEFQWRSRQLTLNFVYRINQKKGRSDRSDFGDGDQGM